MHAMVQSIGPRDLRELQEIVQQRLTESASLEFKRELPPPGKNDDLAKDLAAMSNSGGGVIIYGVEQDDSGAADQLVPLDVNGASERISVVARTLDEPLTPVVKPIQETGTDKGYLVVEVSSSHRAPHLMKGTAWGRTANGNTQLSRRQVGELFARSDGFAAEFGLQIGRPGRVVFRVIPEYRPSPRRPRDTEYFLTFSNDGETPVFDVNWSWEDVSSMPTPIILSPNPFPVDLNPGEEIRVQVALSSTITAVELAPRIRTSWSDARGTQTSKVWTATFG